MNASTKRTSIVIPLLAALLLAAPLATYAESGKGKNGNDDRKGSKIEDSCFRAWGHLIAPGWVKVKGSSDDSLKERCRIPFGISKKLHGTTTSATSTPDATAPVISNLSVSGVSATQATIAWKTNEKSDSSVWISTSSPVNPSGSATVRSGNRVTNHSILLTGLASSTTYYAVVRSKDAAGNAVTSSHVSFTTTAAPVVIKLPVISNVVAIVGSTTAKISWNTDIAADTRLYYSTTSPVTIGATSTVAHSDAALTTAHLVNVSGLATSTDYYFLLQSQSSTGGIQSGSQFGVTTGMGI